MSFYNLLPTKKRFLAIALVASQTIFMAPPAVLAYDGQVRLAGQVVLVNQTGLNNMSAEERTETIQKNLDNALVATEDRSPSSVSIVYVKGVPVITVGGYKVATVDSENAKKANTTPALLAQKWADSLKKVLQDRASTTAYVAHLTGDTFDTQAPQVAQSNIPVMPPQPSQQQGYGAQPQYGAAQQPAYNPYGQAGAGYATPGQYGQFGAPGAPAYGQPGPPAGYQQGYQRGHVVYAPAGLMFPVTLNTSISSQVAKSGDLVQATLSQSVPLGGSSIPAGSVITGTVTDSKTGGFLGVAGTLGIKFNRMRTPNGVETPISARIVGEIGKYDQKGDVVRGETWKTKAGQAAIRGGIGAGTGAALGTAVGAIAGGGRGAGRGAWSGTAIGAGTGVAASLLLRKGKNVEIPSGTPLQIQLDAPVAVSAGGAPPYTGAF